MVKNERKGAKAQRGFLCGFASLRSIERLIQLADYQFFTKWSATIGKDPNRINSILNIF